ncbi:MAG: Gldg family protein [Clostridiales bacterium]|nr:Gldg family protein [Clostridiales bacterium]
MNKKINRSIQFKNGSYSFVITVLVIAVIVVVNLLVNALPASKTTFSISDTDYYSITDKTKSFLKGINNEVNIYLLSNESGTFEEYTEAVCKEFASGSKKIKLNKIDMATEPAFMAKYKLNDTKAAMSVVVENKTTGKYRVVPYNSMVFKTDKYDESGNSYSSWNYDGEGQIASAVNYVTSETAVKVYELTGHNEILLSGTTLPQALAKSNYELCDTPLDLTKGNDVPDDCDVIIIHVPTKDISDSELAILKNYCKNGGNIIVIFNNLGDIDVSNLYSLINYNGIKLVDGLIIEKDDNYHYASGTASQYILMPSVNNRHEITKSLKNSVACLYSSAVKKCDTTESTVNYIDLLSTSSDYQIAYAEKKDEDSESKTYTVDYTEPTQLAVLATNDFGGVKTSSTLVIGCSYFLQKVVDDSTLNSNISIITNTIKYVAGDDSDIYVEVKTLEEKSNHPTKSQSTMLIIIYIGLIPFIFILTGVCNYILRQIKG